MKLSLKFLDGKLWSIILAILVILFAGWLVNSISRRDGFQEGKTVGGTNKLQKGAKGVGVGIK